MKIRINCTIFALLILVRLNECYNILVLYSHPGKSHYDVFKPLFQELGERGHNITIISHVKTAGDIKNGKEVLLSNKPFLNMMDLSWFPGGRIQKYSATHLLAYLGDMSCEPGLKSDNFQTFLKEDHKFDLIMVEFFNSNCFYGIINKYKAPFIGLTSSAMMGWHPQWFGSPDNPSYIPSIYMAYPSPMTFFERVENTLVHSAHKLWYKFFMERPGTALSKKYIGYEPASPYNASLYLSNEHYTLHGVKPLTPAIVQVGGIHIYNKKPKRLPNDIENWTNDSTSGLIYFSLGSLIKGHTFPEEQRKIFIKVFSKLPQKVLWKYETEMIDQPRNLKLTQWAPQYDILCHPNTKLFISHGGLLGTIEAVYCGVPILVMPQFGDQTLNAKALEKSGAGVILFLREATEETLTKALEKALSSETRQRAKELSERFRDRLVPPLETSVYWVEHIAKYKGGKHMRSDAIDMPFYQYFLLDVIAFLGVLISFLSFIFYKSSKFLLSIRCRSKQKVKIS